MTALLVHELFGGDILKTPLPEGDHFYNCIEFEYLRVDLTEGQFAAPVTYLDPATDRGEALAGCSKQLKVCLAYVTCCRSMSC